jgi:CRISPR/Cas system Type II protein with McrA/HNH and RuvC-like nuclease domain
LSKYFQNCFYCEDPLPTDNRLVHVDHVIPWSYIYEDELWNLVLAHEKCNRKKYNSLPSDNFLTKLIDRNLKFTNINNIFKKSILKLDLIENHEKAIKKHYQNCRDYGFTIVNPNNLR